MLVLDADVLAGEFLEEALFDVLDGARPTGAAPSTQRLRRNQRLLQCRLTSKWQGGRVGRDSKAALSSTSSKASACADAADHEATNTGSHTL